MIPREQLLDAIRLKLNQLDAFKFLNVKSSFEALEKKVKELSLQKNESQKRTLSTLDEMLEISLDDGLSLEKALSNQKLFDSFYRELANAVSGFNNAPPYLLSTIDAARLCELAKNGNLEAIKKEKISAYRVNQIVSWAVTSAPATYLGCYNALMIAVSHRQTEVVQYFIEQLGGQLNVMGGRLNNFSVVDCANEEGVFFGEKDESLVSYLDGIKRNGVPTQRPRYSYKDALTGLSFFNSAAAHPATSEPSFLNTKPI